MNTSATPSDMGKTLAVHRFGSKAIYNDIVQSVIFLLGFFAFFFVAPYIPIKGTPNVRSPTAYVVWGCILTILLCLLWTSLKSLKDEAAIFERGLTIKAGRKKVRAAWTEIEAIHETWTLFRKSEMSKGVPLLQSMSIVVKGEAYQVNNHLMAFARLAEAIAVNAYPIIESKVRRQIQDKQSVAFNDLKIRYDGLEVENRHYPWSEIKWIGFPEELGSDYFFAVELNAQSGYLWRKKTDKIPNFRVMHRLLTALRAPVDPMLLQSYAQP
jgi:hypothetical protein